MVAMGKRAGDATSQAELSPLVLPLAPAAARAMPKSVPFMTAGEGVGRRTTVAEAASQLSGRIIVEDVTLQQDGADRVLFVGAGICCCCCCCLIQSEVQHAMSCVVITLAHGQPNDALPDFKHAAQARSDCSPSHDCSLLWVCCRCCDAWCLPATATSFSRKPC